MYQIALCILRGGQANIKGNQAMAATIIERQENAVTIQISIELSRSMLETEEAIQQALNQAGMLATAEALKQFDSDGSPIVMGPTRMTSKGQEPKAYQTPIPSKVRIRRFVTCDGARGGRWRRE